MPCWGNLWAIHEDIINSCQRQEEYYWKRAIDIGRERTKKCLEPLDTLI